MKKIVCWWKGHDPDYGNRNAIPCKRCGDTDIDYYYLVTPPAKEKMKDWLRFWCFRKWFPEKCLECGNRFKCDESVEHMPF